MVLGQNLIFDVRPKMRREDLFDREKELEDLHSNLDVPMIIITGIRRIGKSSILNVFLNEIDYPTIILDLRALRNNYGLKEFYDILSQSISSKIEKLIDFIKSISAIRIAGNEIEIKWKGKGALNLTSFFDHINRKRIIIAFDEAQKLRGPRSNEILNAIAHAYDYDKNISFIFTGSEIGLLYDFLKIKDTTSPLYGRYYYNLTVERFSKDIAKDFLRSGFKEYGMTIDENTIEECVSFFDGIPGWLTFYGNEVVRGHKRFNAIKEMAVNLAKNELRNLIKNRGSKRYVTVLEGIALGKNSWSKIKKYVEEKEETTISKSILYNILNSLEELSIIKDYEFIDPVYREAAKRLYH
ncbi:MAG: ATP-binding protein [Nitrososphaeria archaeon]